MSKTETLSIDLLRLDGDTQARIEVHSDTVDEYAELITASKTKWPFPPLTVYHDGTSYFPADGFHRVLAAAKAGRASIPCDVKKGTARDARFFGMKANDQHGLRMSREDRRKNVVWMLDNYQEMTQANIAENAGVSLRTVGLIVFDRKPANAQIAHVGVAKTQGKTSKPEVTAEQKAAAKSEKDKKKADEAAAKEQAKADAAAEKLREKLEAAGIRQKAKDDAAEDKAEAKAEKERAKAASLTAEGQAKNIVNLIQQHIDKAVRLVDDLAHLRPVSNATKMAVIKALQGVKLW
jgi:flagellar biosynthesis GTPase FlhF